MAERNAKKVPPLYGSGKLVFQAADVKRRYELVRTKHIFENYIIDLEVLESYGLRDEVEALLTAPEWKFLLLEFKEEIYADLVQEVLATLQVPKSFDHASTQCIYFMVGKRAFRYSLDELSAAMGFDEIQNLSQHDKERRWIDIPRRQEFWEELTHKNTQFRSSKVNSSDFVKKEHKFLQYVLAHSICGRRQSSGKVSHTDLLCLYGIIKKKNIHLGYVLGSLFQNQHTEM